MKANTSKQVQILFNKFCSVCYTSQKQHNLNLKNTIFQMSMIQLQEMSKKPGGKLIAPGEHVADKVEFKFDEIDPSQLMMSIKEKRHRYELTAGLNNDMGFDEIDESGMIFEPAHYVPPGSPGSQSLSQQDRSFEVEEAEPLMHNKVQQQIDQVLYPDSVEFLNREVKKFKLISIFTKVQKKLAIALDASYKELYEEAGGGQEDEAKNKAEKIVVNFSSLTALRRIARIGYHVCMVLVVMLVFIIGASMTIRYGTFEFGTLDTTNYKLNVRLMNCQLQIQEGPQLQFKYSAVKSIQAYSDQSVQQTDVQVGSSSDTFSITMLSSFVQTKFCVATLTMPANSKWKEAYVGCLDGSVCYLVCDVPGLTIVGDIQLVGQGTATLYTNLREIYANSFKFYTLVGGLIVGNFATKESFSAFIQTGPITIQSDQEYNLVYQTGYQSLCSSSPVMGPATSTQCFIRGYNESRVFNNSRSCMGQVRLCLNPSGTCQQPYDYSDPMIALINYLNAYNETIQYQTLTELLKQIPGADPEALQSMFTFKGLDTSGLMQVYVTTENGAISANVLKNKLGLPHGNDVYSSGVFELDIEWSTDYKRTLLMQKDAMAADSDFIFSMSIGGPKFMQARSMTFWTFFTNPAFAQLRPWWLATLSGTLLTAQSASVSGFLAPGVCPYQVEPSLEKLNDIQKMIYSTFQKPTGLSSFVQQVGLPIYPELNKEQVIDGNYSTVRWPPRDSAYFLSGETEKWYSIENIQPHFVLTSIGTSQNPPIFLAIALSLLVSLLISCMGIAVSKAAFVVLNDELLEQSVHHGNYCRSANPDTQTVLKSPKEIIMNVNVANILERTKWSIFLRDAPKFSSCIDYYAYTTSCKYVVDSSMAFFKLLFRAATQEEELLLLDGELDEDENLEIGEKELKNLYEKFCFLNHYTELSLTDVAQLQKLELYGFQIVGDEEKAQVFGKLSPRRHSLDPTPSELNTSKTIDLFIKLNYDVTTINTDTEWTEDFEEKYLMFCQEYRLPVEYVRVEDIAIKHNLEVLLLQKMKVLRKIAPKLDDSMGLEVEEESTAQKLINRVFAWFQEIREKLFFKKQVTYLIDRQLLDYHFKILTDPQAFANEELQDFLPMNIWQILTSLLGLTDFTGALSEKELKRRKPLDIMIQTIYYRFWFIMDLIIVAMHVLIVFVLVLPCFAIIIITRLAYAPFSMYHESDILTAADLIYCPWIFFTRLAQFEFYIQILIIIIFYFLAALFLQEILMYYHSQFPEDASFRNNYREIKEAGCLMRSVNIFQWIFIFFLLFIIFFYVGLIAIWLLLGAVINPNNFLVYTSAVSTMILIVTTKINEIEKLLKKGQEEVQMIVDEFYQTIVRDIAGSIIQAIKKGPAQDLLGALGDDGDDDNELGELGGLVREMPGVLASLDTISDPEIVKAKLEEQENKLNEMAQSSLIAKLQEQDLPPELCIMLTKVLFLKQEDLTDTLNEFISSMSKSKLNPRLLKWLTQTLIAVKQYKGGGTESDHNSLKDLSTELMGLNKQLMQAGIEIFIQKSVGRAMDDPKVDEVQKIVVETVQLLLSVQEGKTSNLISMVKTIIQLSSKQDQYGVRSLFIFMKVVDLVDLYFKKQLDQGKLLAFIEEFLDSYRVPPNIGMLLTIIISKSSTYFQYGQFIIHNQQQLSFFIETLLKNLIANLTSKGLVFNEYINFFLPFLRDTFVVLQRMSVYRATPEEIRSVASSLVIFLVQQYFEYYPHIETNELHSQMEDEPNDNPFIAEETLRGMLIKRFSRESVEMLESGLSLTISLAQMLQVMNKDWYQEITTIADRTGTSSDFIQDLSCLGTRTMWNIISSLDKKRGMDLNVKNMYSSRATFLDKQNDIIACISKELRMEDRVLIGLIELMHSEIDHDTMGEYLSDFVFYVSDQVLRAKEEMKRQALLVQVKILCSTNYQDFLQALDLYQDLCTLYRVQFEKSSIMKILQDVVDQTPYLARLFEMEYYVANRINFLDEFQMGFLEYGNKAKATSPPKRCNFYSLVTQCPGNLALDNKDKIMTLLLQFHSQRNAEIVVTLIEFVSIKVTLKPITQVTITERSTALAKRLNFKYKSLVYLANIVMFDSAELVSQAVTYFCQPSLISFGAKMNQLSENNPMTTNVKVFRDKVTLLSRIFIDVDAVFEAQSMQPMISTFLPDWLDGNHEIILNNTLETSFKVGKAAQVKLTNKVLELFKPIFEQKFHQFDELKKTLSALVSRQDNLLKEMYLRMLASRNIRSNDLLGLIKALTNDDIFSLLTIIFCNMYKRSLLPARKINESFLIIVNTMAAFVVRNHNQISEAVNQKNKYLSSLQMEQILDLNGKPIKQFEWHEDFIWMVSHLKYFFTVDQKSFTQFTTTLFKKMYRHCSISQKQIEAIMSLYSDTPNLDTVASMLKVPPQEIEFANLLCRLTISRQVDKLQIINEFKNSSAIANMLAKIQVDLNEFSYLLKLITKNLSAKDWRDFIRRIKFGEGANLNIINALLALTVSFDNMIVDDQEELKINFNLYREMREKLFVNLGLNAEIMELVFNIKKGRISHLKFLNDENKLVGKQTKLFGGSNKIVEIVTSLIAIVVLDPTNSYLKLDKHQILKLLIQLDEPYFIRNSIESALFLMYQHLGVSPLVVLAILGNKRAIEMISFTLENQSGVSLRWSHVQALQQAMGSRLSHTKKLKIMECEFMSLIAGNIVTIGLDDDMEDMNQLKAEKANIAMMKQTMIAILIQQLGDPLLQQIVDPDNLDLSQLFKVNPKKNKNLWAVNHPVSALMLLAQIKMLRNILQEKQYNNDKQSQRNSKIQKAFQFVLSYDLVFSICERMLFIDHHETAKGFNKPIILQTIALVFQNKNITKEKKLFDVIPITVFDLICYPSLYNPTLTDRYYVPAIGDLKVPSNPFILDFSKDLPLLGKAKSFKEDPEVRRRAISKQLYLNREIYQQCFMRIIVESSNLERKHLSIPPSGNQSNYSSIFYEEWPFDQQMTFATTLAHIAFKGEYYEYGAPRSSPRKRRATAGIKQASLLFSGPWYTLVDRISPESLLLEVNFQTVKCSVEFTNIFNQQIEDHIYAFDQPTYFAKVYNDSIIKLYYQASARDKNFDHQQVKNLMEIQHMFAYLLALQPNLKNLFSHSPQKLKAWILQLCVKNRQIFIGSEQTIDLVLALIEYIRSQVEILPKKLNISESRAVTLLKMLKTEVRFKSNSSNLIKLLLFIVDPQHVEQETVDWLIEYCFEGKKQIFYAVMLPYLSILRDRTKLNIELSHSLQYLTFGEGMNLQKMGQYPDVYRKLMYDYPLWKVNNLRVGEALEDMLEKVQSIPQNQRSFFKIMIRCYTGDIEAWISLMDQVGFFGFFPSQQLIIKSLFMQVLMGFKGTGLRGQISEIKLAKMTILEIISTTPFKAEFFRILETCVPREENNGFSKFREILLLIVDRRYTQLIDKVPDLMQFIKFERSGLLDDINALTKLTIMFIAINKLPEQSLPVFLQEILGRSSRTGLIKIQEVISEFTIDFSEKVLDVKQFQPLIIMMLQYSYTHDLSVVFQQFLRYESLFEKVGCGEIIRFNKYFVSINMWFKMKYFPSMVESNHLLDGLPGIVYPIYLLTERIIGMEQLSNVMPAYQKVFQRIIFNGTKKENMHQDVFVHQLLVLKEITRNIDLKSTSNLISPSLIGFLMKGFGEFSDETEQLQRLMKKFQFEQLYSQVQPLFSVSNNVNSQQLIEVWQMTLQQPAIGKLMEIAEQFAISMVGQFGFAQINKTEFTRSILPAIECILESEIKSTSEELDRIKILVRLIVNMYGFTSSPEINKELYSQTMNNLQLLLGDQDLTNILLLIGDFMTDGYIDQDELNKLGTSLLVTLTDEKAFMNPKIADSEQQRQQAQNNMRKIINFACYQPTLMKKYQEIQTNGISQKTIVTIIVDMLTILLDGNEALRQVTILNTFISLYQKNFAEIEENFFFLLKVTPERTKAIMDLIKSFTGVLEKPQQLIEQKRSQLLKKADNPTSQRMDLILQKVAEGAELTKHDFFLLIDVSGDGFIDLQEYQRFLKRTGINLTDHKLLEICTKVKGGAVAAGEEITLNLEEFEKAVVYIFHQTIQLTLESLGMTKEIMNFALIYLIFLVLIFFAFILVGIQAFAIPGTFGSIINSMFPMAGGGGISNAKKPDVEELFDKRKLTELTKKCMKIVQSMKI